MPKVVLGKTPEDLEKEKAEREREIELDLQKRVSERQAKLEALHNAQKRYKIIILAVGGLIIGAILIFGIYNTFIKKNLNETDVSNIIVADYGGIIFPYDGVLDYLRHNGEDLIKKYIGGGQTSTSNIKIDENSYNIIRIKKISTSYVEVIFGVNVIANQPDMEVTDPSITSQVNVSGTSEVKAKVNGQERTYFLRDGKLIQKGGEVTTRYNFTLPLYFKTPEVKEETDNNSTEETTTQENKVTPSDGYILGGDLSLYPLFENNQEDFSEITYGEMYQFPEKTIVENKEADLIKTKVEKVLDDLYAGRDTSQDVLLNRKFNNYNAKLNKVNKIEAHTVDNASGYNTYVEYTITTEQGFNLNVNTFLKVESSGNSYVITKML